METEPKQEQITESCNKNDPVDLVITVPRETADILEMYADLIGMSKHKLIHKVFKQGMSHVKTPFQQMPFTSMQKQLERHKTAKAASDIEVHIPQDAHQDELTPSGC